MVFESESSLECRAKFRQCAERPKAAPGNIVAGGVLYRLRVLVRLQSARHHASGVCGDACSRQTSGQSIEKHSTGDAGGTTGRSFRCGASGSQANPPLPQKTFHLRLARDRRVILCQDNEGGATQRQKAICLASGEDVIGNDSPPCWQAAASSDAGGASGTGAPRGLPQISGLGHCTAGRCRGSCGSPIAAPAGADGRLRARRRLVVQRLLECRRGRWAGALCRARRWTVL